MKHTLAVLLALTFLSPGLRAAPDDATWKSDIETWRAKRAAALQAPEGWLSLIGLDWLKDGDNSFGAAADNRIQVNAKISDHAGVVRLAGGKVHLLPPSGGFPKEVQVDGHPAKEQDLLADDTDQPSKITINTTSIIIINRDGRFALRIKDPQAPTRTAFHGLKWYAPDPAYRIHAKWIPYLTPKTLDIPTVLGTTTHMPAPGAAEFTIDGQTVRLEPVLEDPKSTDLFFILRDATSKTTTYGAGRFLYTGLPDHGLNQPGELVLDFNRAINPPCSFTPYATCPLPPSQNRLSVAIPAGEKRYHD
ncbi:MAG TPA: DUF1684 domain-containing protein [Terriglobales bacterium]|nr:DUF1684 domain-containing protein [Terriglobales bacterium]